MNDVCCIFNHGTHYNASIYRLLDEVIHCDFYLGDNLSPDLKRMNYSDLVGFKAELRNKSLFVKFHYQVGAIPLILSRYRIYILTGDPYCISTWIILVVAKFLGKKTVLWSHGWYGRESGLKVFFKSNFFRMASHVLLYGNYAKELMVSQGFNPSKFSVVFNSLDDQRTYPIRNQLLDKYLSSDNELINCEPRILYIGRIQRIKRLDLLILAIAELHRKGHKVWCDIVGVEIDNTDLLSLVLLHDLSEYIEFHGEVYDQSLIGELIYRSSICVSPGNVGLTAILSMMYGTPVISHNNFKNQMPEFEAILPGMTGDFFIEGNFMDLSDVLERWLFNNDYARSEIRENCFKMVDEYYNSGAQIGILSRTLEMLKK